MPFTCASWCRPHGTAHSSGTALRWCSWLRPDIQVPPVSRWQRTTGSTARRPSSWHSRATPLVNLDFGTRHSGFQGGERQVLQVIGDFADAQGVLLPARTQLELHQPGRAGGRSRWASCRPGRRQWRHQGVEPWCAGCHRFQCRVISGMVALTLTPALCAIFLSKKEPTPFTEMKVQ